MGGGKGGRRKLLSCSTMTGLSNNTSLEEDGLHIDYSSILQHLKLTMNNCLHLSH